MDTLRELYQEVIFDHNKNPRNFHKLEPCNHHADGMNPLCGDQITVYLHLSDEKIIENVSFEGEGCAISTASASIMTEVLKGKTTAEAKDIFDVFHAKTTGEPVPESLSDLDIGKLEVLVGVQQYPTRVKCATLAWHTLQAAIESPGETISTE
jgi:SUF system FeS assembly protein, NifU family